MYEVISMKKNRLPDFLDDDSCSARDCTGLIPSAPADDAERMNYEEVYKYLPPKNEFQHEIKARMK